MRPPLCADNDSVSLTQFYFVSRCEAVNVGYNAASVTASDWMGLYVLGVAAVPPDIRVMTPCIFFCSGKFNSLYK